MHAFRLVKGKLKNIALRPFAPSLPPDASGFPCDHMCNSSARPCDRLAPIPSWSSEDAAWQDGKKEIETVLISKRLLAFRKTACPLRDSRFLKALLIVHNLPPMSRLAPGKGPYREQTLFPRTPLFWLDGTSSQILSFQFRADDVELRGSYEFRR